MGETLKLTESESLEIVGSGPDGLEVVATYGPGGKAPPKHSHPAQDESFRVLEGALRARVGDAERELTAGDELEIPRRTPHQMWNPNPEPARVSASAAGRSEDWKFAFVGSRDRSTGTLHLPPARVSPGGAIDDMEPAPMADTEGTIVTFTIDKLAYSPSPPIVFAVVDFDGGGRFPVEMTDVDAADVQIGDRVEMTFRRLFTADGIHDYFWKGRLVR